MQAANAQHRRETEKECAVRWILNSTSIASFLLHFFIFISIPISFRMRPVQLAFAVFDAQSFFCAIISERQNMSNECDACENYNKVATCSSASIVLKCGVSAWFPNQIRHTIGIAHIFVVVVPSNGYDLIECMWLVTAGCRLPAVCNHLCYWLWSKNTIFLSHANLKYAPMCGHAKQQQQAN